MNFEINLGLENIELKYRSKEVSKSERKIAIQNIQQRCTHPSNMQIFAKGFTCLVCNKFIRRKENDV
jgi:hypothetical protein